MPRKETPEEPLLFDLPMGRSKGTEREEGAEEDPLRPAPERGRERKPGPERLRALELPLDSQVRRDVAPEEEELGEDGPEKAPRGSRFLAGLADLVTHAAVGVIGVIGARQMGLRPALSSWPGFALFLLAFSFLYVVVSLAFWGHTLGMVWAGLTARSRDGEALSFDQAVRRWLGGILTSGLAGLPLLLSWNGRTVSDLLSSSETLGRGADEA